MSNENLMHTVPFDVYSVSLSSFQNKYVHFVLLLQFSRPIILIVSSALLTYRHKWYKAKAAECKMGYNEKGNFALPRGGGGGWRMSRKSPKFGDEYSTGQLNECKSTSLTKCIFLVTVRFAPTWARSVLLISACLPCNSKAGRVCFKTTYVNLSLYSFQNNILKRDYF